MYMSAQYTVHERRTRPVAARTGHGLRCRVVVGDLATRLTSGTSPCEFNNHFGESRCRHRREVITGERERSALGKTGDHVGESCRSHIVDAGSDDDGHGDAVPMLDDGSMTAKEGRERGRRLS